MFDCYKGLKAIEYGLYCTAKWLNCNAICILFRRARNSGVAHCGGANLQHIGCQPNGRCTLTTRKFRAGNPAVDFSRVLRGLPCKYRTTPASEKST